MVYKVIISHSDGWSMKELYIQLLGSMMQTRTESFYAYKMLGDTCYYTFFQIKQVHEITTSRESYVMVYTLQVSLCSEIFCSATCSVCSKTRNDKWFLLYLMALKSITFCLQIMGVCISFQIYYFIFILAFLTVVIAENGVVCFFYSENLFGSCVLYSHFQ